VTVPHETPLLTTMAAAFAVAWALGLLARKLRLSPIVGYLLAGVVIGPHTPGFVGDVALARQLAEVGVVLLMFGVGLHFHVQDLADVRWIAVPGALIQSCVATLMGLGLGAALGWPLVAGLVLGMALSVASTVVLLRGLEDHDLTASPSGHIAIGWLIVEDVFTVVVLVVIPALAHLQPGQAAAGSLLGAVAIALGKLAALVALVFVAGSRLVPWILVKVAHLRSRELFTLTLLACALAVAAGAARFFGVSMALGAFLAGMVVGQSRVSQQAGADLLPLRDAFAVLFFVSVGMLFEPTLLLREPLLLAAALAIVLVGKPLAALLVVAVLGYSVRTGLVVAVGLAQVGEFTFILGDVAREHGLLSAAGASLLVACALVSISINPLLFAGLEQYEDRIRRWPALQRVLGAAAARRRDRVNRSVARESEAPAAPLAVIVGYGPVGQAVDRALRETGLHTVVIDLNLETVSAIASDGRAAVFGDASQAEVLAQAGVRQARLLVVTLPHSVNRAPMVAAARRLNPTCQILVRARYLRERAGLEQVGADAACFEEAEAAVALTRRVLLGLDMDTASVDRETERVRRDTLGDLDARPDRA
jgi:CPA2 family monovalent cation:H+ antiporter-2